MSEKSDEGQEPKPDLNPESIDSILSDVDALLAEEDPEFFNKIKDINIDPSQVLSEGGSIDIENIANEDFKVYLRRPFEFQTNTQTVAIFWSVTLVVLAILAFV